MKRIAQLILLSSLPFTPLLANGLEITNVSPNADYTQVSFDISWENSWRQTERFHDAVWVFVKYKPDNSAVWEHASITGGITDGDLEIITEEDSVGIFMRNADDFAGNVPVTKVTLNVSLNPELIIHPDFKVFGIEMVYVPEGPFKFGDGTIISDPDLPDTDARSVRDKNKVVLGSIDSAGYHSIWFEGTGLGYAHLPLPEYYPKGFTHFYCMKYPITQGQYVDFLNCLTANQQRFVLDFNDERNYFLAEYPDQDRQGIFLTGEMINGRHLFVHDLNQNGKYNEPADGKDIVLSFDFKAPATKENYLKRYLSFLFWTGLRPMTELEFEKACRGPMKPVKFEKAWGIPDTGGSDPELVQAGTSDERFTTNTTISPGFFNGASDDTPELYRVGIAADSSDDRLASGKTFWGIADMTTNGHELVVAAEYEEFYREGYFDKYVGGNDFFYRGFGYIERYDVIRKSWNLKLVNYFLLKSTVSGVQRITEFLNTGLPGEKTLHLIPSGRGVREP